MTPHKTRTLTTHIIGPIGSLHPGRVVTGAVGLAGTAVGLADAVVRATVRVVTQERPGHAPHQVYDEPRTDGVPGAAGTGPRGEAPGPGRTVPSAPSEPTASTEPTEAGAPTEAGVPAAPVIEEPTPPTDEPVDVVEQAIANDEATASGHPAGFDARRGAGLAHEPSAASRDEAHGDAQLQRAEVEEIAEEAEAALHGDEEPVVPEDEPLLEPGEAKAVVSESETLSRAADPDKG